MQVKLKGPEKSTYSRKITEHNITNYAALEQADRATKGISRIGLVRPGVQLFIFYVINMSNRWDIA